MRYHQESSETKFTQNLRVLVALWSAQSDSELEVVERIADELEAELGASSIDDIDDLYRKLSSILAEPPTATSEQEYQVVLRRLRELQEIEAAEMEAVFERRNPFDDRLATDALQRAEGLISGKR